MSVALSRAEARALLLAAQGLSRRPTEPPDKAAVLTTIRQMGALQIDTISVVARSPYLVLWSRLGDYEPVWLDELLAEGELFEYWSHAACLLPIEHYPLYRPRMRTYATAWGWAGARAWIAEHRDEMDRMLALVRERGSVRSADFERPEGHKSGWWGWKPDKRALEALYSVGELMIARRERFQRIYDLPERVLRSRDLHASPDLELDADEARRRLAVIAVRALGITRSRWLADYFRTPKAGNAALLESLADEGSLLRVRVEGWDGPAYLHPDHAALAADIPEPELTTLLSPFDPLVWDRQRARDLFDFDYTIECYTPAARRRYGYFTLPILHRGDLVGRLDPKAHRQQGIFEVKSIHLEPGVPLTEELVADLANALRDCAAWHRTPKLAIGRTDPRPLAPLLRRALTRNRRILDDAPAIHYPARPVRQ